MTDKIKLLEKLVDSLKTKLEEGRFLYSPEYATKIIAINTEDNEDGSSYKYSMIEICLDNPEPEYGEIKRYEYPYPQYYFEEEIDEQLNFVIDIAKNIKVF